MAATGTPVFARYPSIAKPREGWRVEPNLLDYDAERAAFSWATARRRLEGLPGGGLNIAHEAVDRHAKGPYADRVAFRFLGRDDSVTDVTYAALSESSSRFANVLRRLGLAPGDVVTSLAGRIPDLYVAALGTLKARCVFSPLFSAFGPEPIRARMTIAKARVLVTTPELYRRKIEPMRSQLTDLQVVLLGGHVGSAQAAAGTLDLHRLLAASEATFDIPPTSPDDPALLHFTSGTTGLPKGALHVHDAVTAHHITGRYALDLHPDDVYWCTADPGWVTGMSYGVIAPLTHGVTTIVDEGDFEAERWYSIVRDHKVSVWYTAPTAIRMMMKAGRALAKRFDLSSLRFLASVGEPLNPEAVVWSAAALGLPFHDNWWQTETGGIMIANYAACEIRPGSMGRPLPGIDACIVRRTGAGAIERVEEPDVEGELALTAGWPSMFRGYVGDEARYERCFASNLYLTGDLVRRDRDGYYWFVGRSDDVIKSSGHLIGPFEVESALLEHPGVAEAGVIGKPDPVSFEMVKAFVSLKPGFVASDALARELMGFARVRLGSAVAPKEITFVESVPRNRAGKIMRRLLKARELGLPEGDISTLELPE